MKWATNTAKFGPAVEGIFPNGVDGSFIGGIDFNEDESLIATGNKLGIINIYRNPCMRAGTMPISLRGHAGEVKRVLFHKKGEYLFSIGGKDQTLLQFRRH